MIEGSRIFLNPICLYPARSRQYKWVLHSYHKSLQVDTEHLFLGSSGPDVGCFFLCDTVPTLSVADSCPGPSLLVDGLLWCRFDGWVGADGTVSFGVHLGDTFRVNTVLNILLKYLIQSYNANLTLRYRENWRLNASSFSSSRLSMYSATCPPTMCFLCTAASSSPSENPGNRY